jgi:hypothetical protein
MFADFERLIVMRVVSSRLDAEFVYEGPVAPVWAAAEAMQKNGKIRSGQAACFRSSIEAMMVSTPAAIVAGGALENRAVTGSDRSQLANVAREAKAVLQVDKLEAVADRATSMARRFWPASRQASA